MFLDLGTGRWLEKEEMVWMVRSEKLEAERRVWMGRSRTSVLLRVTSGTVPEGDDGKMRDVRWR